jgi:hypothetical protein
LTYREKETARKDRVNERKERKRKKEGRTNERQDRETPVSIKDDKSNCNGSS